MKWQRKINIKDAWKKCDEDGNVQELAIAVISKLKGLKPFNIESVDQEKDDLIIGFMGLAKDENASVEDFDFYMSLLYNWADMSLDGKFGGKKVCWIEL